MKVGSMWLTQRGSQTLDTLPETGKMGGRPTEHVRSIWCWPHQSLFLSLDKVGTQVTMDDEDTRSERKQVTSSGTENTDHSLPASWHKSQALSLNRAFSADSPAPRTGQQEQQLWHKQTMSRNNYSNQRTSSIASESIPFSRARLWWCPYYHGMKTLAELAVVLLQEIKKGMHMFSKRHVQGWS